MSNVSSVKDGDIAIISVHRKFAVQYDGDINNGDQHYAKENEGQFNMEHQCNVSRNRNQNGNQSV